MSKCAVIRRFAARNTQQAGHLHGPNERLQRAIRAVEVAQQARHAASGIRSNPVAIRLRNLYQKNNNNKYGLLGGYAAQLWLRS